jgi:hypothetical protein
MLITRMNMPDTPTATATNTQRTISIGAMHAICGGGGGGSEIGEEACDK